MKYTLILLLLLTSCNSNTKEVKINNKPIIEKTIIIEEKEEKNIKIEIVKEKLYDIEVEYTEEWYFPDNFTVPIWTKVWFINKTDILMWTASDPHPVHTDYSLFDSEKSYKKNEIYILSFDDTWTYWFHNHEKSLHRWIIKVIDPKNPKPNIDKTKESQKATRDKLLDILDENDSDSIFTLIDKIEADNILSRNCHDMAHDLWHKSYELYGFSTAMTFNNPKRASHTSIDDICAGWYMHWILEELFLHHPELKQNPEKVCSSVPDEHSWSCFHGVWHWVMFANLRNVEKSLLSCRSLSTNTFTYRCFEWVWMELFWWNTDHAWANSLWWNLDKPFDVCKNAKLDEKPTCYLYAHLWYLRTHPRDYQWVINFCTKKGLLIEDSKFCLKWIWITMMKHFTSRNLEKTEKLVENLSYDLKFSYYWWVIWYSLLSWMNKSKLKEFCNILKKDTKVCLDVLKVSK